MNSKTTPFVLLVLLAFVLFLAGCAVGASSGNELNRASLDRIEKGETTRAEAESILGRPSQVILTGENKVLLQWVYSESRSRGFGMGGMDTRLQTLQLLVNEDGIVENYEFNDSTSEVRTRMGR